MLRLLAALAILTTVLAQTPTTTESPEPTPSADPNRAPPAAQGAWGRGFIEDGSYLPGNYVDGYEYLDWAWALIYRPIRNGTFCLDAYNQQSEHPDIPSAMVAYIADSNDKGSAAFIAGSWVDYAGAACVSGVDASCVDIFAQWGNKTYAAQRVHCFACGDASHSAV